MADSSDNEKTTPEITVKQDEKNEKAATPAGPPRLKSLLALLFSSISLLLIGFLFYSLWQMKDQHAKQMQTLQTQNAEIRETQQNITTGLKQSVDDLQQEQKLLQKNLTATEKRLQDTLQQSQYQGDDWKLLKARYFLELAQMNTHWSYDSQTTQALLQEADKVLANIHSQHLFKLRQMMAEKIAMIKAQPQVDKTGILSQLDALKKQIFDLSLKTPLFQSLPADENKVSGAAEGNWKHRLQANFNLLSKLVVIRRHDERIEPMLSEQQVALLRAGIMADFASAQLAVLQSNEAMFCQTLKQAISAIEHTFANDTRTKALVQQLKKLETISLVQEKPDIQPALDLLNQLIQSKTQIISSDTHKEHAS